MTTLVSTEPKKADAVSKAQPRLEDKPKFEFNERKAKKAAKPKNPFDFIGDDDSINEVKQDRRDEKRKKNVSIIKNAALCALVIYVCFLIFGVFLTKYTYNEFGNVIPEVLTVEEIKDLKQFELLNAYYLRARSLYEDVLKLDYKLYENPDNALTIAMEYTEKLETVDKLATDLKAAEYNVGYAAIYDQLTVWVSTDIAVYLQKVATAITNNDAVAEADAVLVKDIVQSDFAIITSNIATLANATKGANVDDLYTWTPNNFLNSLDTEGSN